MSKETHQISDLMPDNSEFSLKGQLSLNSQLTINRTHASAAGDLFRNSFEMRSEVGNAKVFMLGKKHYTAVWGTYHHKPGMVITTQLNQPFIGLCFQMNGFSRAFQSTMDFKLNICPGEANLVIMPPMNETFEIKEKLGGKRFSILLSQDYLQDLSSRFPHSLEPILTQIKKKDLCLYKEKNLRITPRMLSVIQRIQHPEIHEVVGSMFLEAQILDLLALMFSQKKSSSFKGNSISRSDQERIYRAKEILVERLEAPPTLTELSRLVGTNEFKLKRGFKELFDTSPYAYHLHHKLELARSYILDTDLTIAEIGYRVGYSDPAHFTNAFRKHFDLRPSDLR